MQKITPFLWFDGTAEEAANYYLSVFKNSRIVGVSRYNKTSAASAGRLEGSAMSVSFELDGQKFVALNGGPHYQINEAISFVVNCESQLEVDYYWERLASGGDPASQRCGWLKDKFGVSWQVVPTELSTLLQGPKANQVMPELMKMGKIELAKLKAACESA